MTHNTANASPHRLLSLDAYRGFVILMMIWVNYIAEMPNLPAWLKHATATQDTFTFPDLVFPGFLFMAGMAIPLALRRRLQQSASLQPVLMKILWRSFSLVVAGVMMVNAYRYDAGQALLPRPLYYTLFYLAMILLWQEGGKRDVRFWLGAALMIFLITVFRGQVNEEFSSVWLQGSWWGILGMIGWAYLCCSLAYVVTRGDGVALMGIFALMIALYMADRQGALASLPAWLTDRIGIGELFGSTAANMLAGTLAGNLLCKDAGIEAGDETGMRQLHRRRIRFMCWFAFGMIVAALLLRPYHGINKIAATESYTLICAGINLVAFIVFYIVIEVWKRRTWTVVLVPLGINALFAYILPDVWDQLMALIGAGHLWFSVAWPFLDSGGIPGLLNAALISIFMLMLTVGAGHLGLRLKF